MAEKGSVTLNDVAAEAGVSTASVSRVLNMNSRISSATRERVMQAVRKLGYDASSITRKAAVLSQSPARTYRFEMLLCPMSEQKDLLLLEFYRDIIAGIQTVLLERGNAVLSTCTLPADPASHENRMVVNRLMEADVVFVMGHQGLHPDFFDPLLEKGIPVITIGRKSSDRRINTVELDDFDASQNFVHYLAELGYRRLGVLDIKASGVFQRRRLAAMLAAQEEADMEPVACCTADSTEDRDIRLAFSRWFNAGNRPECMIATHFHAAVVLYDFLREHGLHCPEDMGIVTFDAKTVMLPGIDVVFSGYETCPHVLGEKAARRAFELLNPVYKDDRSHRILIPLRFREGNSVKGGIK